MRCGMPRIFWALADVIKKAGWEFIGQGLHQEAMHTEDSEAGTIERALNVISTFSGGRMQGWLGPSLRQANNTPDILRTKKVD